jgi:hypothetical protein
MEREEAGQASPGHRGVEGRGNSWAVASLMFALAPFAFFAGLVVLERVAPGLDDDALARFFYVSVPTSGILAVVTGAVGWRRPGHRVMSRVGVSLGAVEVLATLLIVIALVSAFRTMGIVSWSR